MLKKILAETAASLLLLAGVFMITRYAGLAASAKSVHIGKEKPVVVLDAGHGGGRMRRGLCYGRRLVSLRHMG